MASNSPDSPTEPSNDMPLGAKAPSKTLQQIAAEVGLYPLEAFHFVHAALTHTAAQLHGPQSEPVHPPRVKRPGSKPAAGGSAAGSAGKPVRGRGEPNRQKSGPVPAPPSRHISGRQLCEGFRQLSLLRWGMLARTVLRRWNMHRTDDVGRIVFALVDGGFLSKTAQDTAADFCNIYDFRAAFEMNYCFGKIELLNENGVVIKGVFKTAAAAPQPAVTLAPAKPAASDSTETPTGNAQHPAAQDSEPPPDVSFKSPA